MAIEDYLPFDPDSPQSNTQGEVGDIFSQYGFTNWRDVFFDIQDTASVDPDATRGARYSTPEEALFDLSDRGMLAFSHIVYYEDEDLYGIYVDYED